MRRISRHPFGFSCRILLIVLVLMASPFSAAMAGTTTVPGTAATIAPLDNFGATINSQLVLTWVKILGVVLVIGGALSMLRIPGLGALGVVAGLFIIFANPIVEATFTATSAAPLELMTTTGTWTVPALLRPVMVLAYYPYLVLHTLLRPEVWLAVACCSPIRRAIRFQPAA